MSVPKPLPQFFLRFYDRSIDQVDEFLKAYCEKFPQIADVIVGQLTGTVNQVLPAGPCWEADVVFNTKAERDAVYTNVSGQEMYLKFVGKVNGASGLGTFAPVQPKSKSPRRAKEDW